MSSKQMKIGVVEECGYIGTARIDLGNNQIEYNFLIICPNQEDTKDLHYFTLNGHDTHYNTPKQQYYCQTCGKSFYAHTSRIFKEFENNIKKVIKETINGGHLEIEKISKRLNIKNSTAGRILKLILGTIVNSTKHHKSFLRKRRRSKVLFVDETFITIHRKTWYVIVVVSGNDKIMDVKLVRHRSKDVLLEIIKDCEKRLLYGLKILITDGFMPYKGVAKAIGHALIHVRHIHKPPYGRIEFDTYKYESGKLRITTGKTTNEITKVNGYFIVRVSENVENLTKGKRGRKKGGKNRPKKVIEEEKNRKAERKLKRGRPKGSKNSVKNEEFHVFFHAKKRGCIEQQGGSSEEVTATLNEILKQFPDMFITTNLVEKEYSVLKKLICFRGHRDVDIWIELLIAYYTIRDDPKILESALKRVKLSSKNVIQALPSIMRVEVMAN